MRQWNRISQASYPSEGECHVLKEKRKGTKPLNFSPLQSVLLAVVLGSSVGCTMVPRNEAGALSQSLTNGSPRILVDAATAVSGSEGLTLVYTGTTEPIQEVTVRSQTEGQLLNLEVNIGDRVRRGQVIAEIDKSLPTAVINQAQAELSARQVEVSQSQSEISQLQTQIEIAKLELTQAQADAQRLKRLYQEGAVSEQEAELAQTAAQRAQQALRSAESQVVTQQKVVAAAKERVTAQQAIVTQAKERQSYAAVESPLSGTVVARLTETGNVIRQGDELLKIADFSQVKVNVAVSELDLAQVYVGQSVKIRLDAFPQEEFTGEVTRISPVADPVARLIPVEVTIPNRTGRLGSGLLARARFELNDRQMMWVPESALSNREDEDGTLFVVEENSETIVRSRRVIVGTVQDGEAEILSGLEAGERYVVKSSQPLKDGDRVELSILSGEVN